jgi:hypothetical protein
MKAACPAPGDDRRLIGVLEEIRRGGWRLVAVVDPRQQLQALAMVVNGMADVVVVAKPEHFSVVHLASGPAVVSNGMASKRGAIPA